MNNKDKLHRSNMILIILVLLFLLYGIVYRVQSGDNKLYIFGMTVELPFGGQESTEEEAPGSEKPEETPSGDAGSRSDPAVSSAGRLQNKTGYGAREINAG